MSDAWKAGIEAAAQEIDHACLGTTEEQDFDLADRVVRAFLAAAEANGWRCVPIGITDPMKEAGMDALLDGSLVWACDAEVVYVETATPRVVWWEMTAAAPRIEGEG